MYKRQCQNTKAVTDKYGFYVITVPAKQKATLVFTHVTLKESTKSFTLKEGEIVEYNPVLSSKNAQLDEVIITNNRGRVQGIISIEPEVIRRNQSLSGGIERDVYKRQIQ